MNDNVNERLARIERENRRMKMVGALMLALIAGVFLLAQTTPPTVQETVMAKSFTLVDGSGNIRAALAVKDDGSAGLRYYDLEGKPRAFFDIGADGSPYLGFFKDGKPRATFSTLADGTPGLWVYDKDGEGRAFLCTNEDGSPGLSLFDKDGKVRGAFGVLADGTPTLAFFDKDGKTTWSARKAQ